MENLKATYSEKIAYSIGAMSKDVIYWFISAYLMLYFTDIVGWSAALVGFIFFIGKVANAVLDPFLGFIIDNSHTRYDKFKPWILIGYLLTSISLVLLFLFPENQSFISFSTYTIIFYFLSLITYSLMDIPFWSLIPNFGTVGNTRLEMTASAKAMAVVGGQVILICGTWCITELTIFSDQGVDSGFLLLVLLCVAFFLITQALLCYYIKPRRQKFKYAKFSLSKALQIILKNDQLLASFSIVLLQQIAINVVSISLIFYCLKDHVITNKDFTLLMTLGAITQVISFIFLPKLIHIFSRKRIFYSASFFMLCGYSLMIFLPLNSSMPILLCLCFALTSCGMALLMGLTTVMMADCVDYGEFKNGIRSEALIFSLQTSAAKLGNGIAIFMSGLTLSVTAYIPHDISFVHQEFSFRLSLVIICLLLITSIWLYSRYYKLNGKLFKSMLNTLEKIRTSDGHSHDIRRLIRYAVDENNVILKLKVHSLDEALNPHISCFARHGVISSTHEFRLALNQRLKASPCGIAEGIAIPHARGECVKRPAIGVAVL